MVLGNPDWWIMIDPRNRSIGVFGTNAVRGVLNCSEILSFGRKLDQRRGSGTKRAKLGALGKAFQVRGIKMKRKNGLTGATSQ